MKTSFDAVIVGAGPAGATAAYFLAKWGFDVLLIDRGRGSGSKQVFGGRIYADPIVEVFGDIKDAPIHRWVTRERITVIDNYERVVSVEYSSSGSRKSFTTYLTEFASWITMKAVESGAVFVDEVRVDSLVRDSNGRIVGVKAQEDTVFSRIVVDAEGANRLLLERAGLASKASPEMMALGVKEVIKLGREELEKRFMLSENEGLAWILVGSITGFLPGGAFLYTNRDTVSLGIVIHLGSALRARIQEQVAERVEERGLSKRMAPYLAGGDIIEYSAHLTIESGYRFMPKRLVADGLIVVGDAAGFLLNTGLTFRGVDYAVYSGYLAAKAIKEIHEKGLEYNAPVLEEYYAKRIKNSFIYRDLSRHREIERLMSDPRAFKLLVSLLPTLFSKIMELGNETPTILEASLRSLRELGIPLHWILFHGYRLVKHL